ncbi:MAG: hypothetical protein MK295_09765 [Pseudomonadales bacterium]|uniref:Uncharacterized protein n=1 Tax=marine metagenome TaxID=408172 RepID=A0A381QDH7_9ZZZZ|nr:hypothetical protein [Pseudomonadales bacterium]MCS5569171.1 hypothetical protein [Pseudomonadales bacterium]MED5555801.1 hypothetical protein [Pseudomonadota bacterium]MEE3132402.1 hypothetical protein [Pseudomonadota bacterium]
MRRRLINALFNDSLVALIAVLIFSLTISAIFIVLSWITYRDRYGISLLEFLGFTF